MKKVQFKSGDRILFQGDSITDAGRQGDRFGMGDGYPGMIKAFFAVTAPELELQFVNRGTSGDRSIDLVNKWQKECLDLAPTHVSIMIGVNDIWRRFDGNEPLAIALPDYKTYCRRMIESCVEANIRNLILMTPTTVDADPNHPSNKMCAEYAAAVEAFAREYGATLVPARDRVWQAVRSGPDVAFWLPDGVHPSAAGHAVLAAAWLEAVGMTASPRA